DRRDRSPADTGVGDARTLDLDARLDDVLDVDDPDRLVRSRQVELDPRHARVGARDAEQLVRVDLEQPIPVAGLAPQPKLVDRKRAKLQSHLNPQATRASNRVGPATRARSASSAVRTIWRATSRSFSAGSAG